jgi:thiopeptide-type bacteriocin biosynthesis protein
MSAVAAESKYLSVHIYYNTFNLRTVLLWCVDPIVKMLESDGLIQRFFMVRYWEGGVHVRLRLLPAQGVSQGQIKERIEPLIRAFLQQRPSLFDADAAVVTPIMRKLFESEYGQDAFIEQYGEFGQIPLEPNNSFAYVPYKPEFERYGGPAGLALAEEHFHFSSTIALEAIRGSNSHVDSCVLGLAMQLMLHLAWTFTDDNREVESFFREYGERWTAMMDPSWGSISNLDLKYSRQRDALINHVLEAKRILGARDQVRSPVLGLWLDHACWLRASLHDIYAAGQLEFNPPARSEAEATIRLLSHYIHMMNNRLGVVNTEEVYLATMLACTMKEINESSHLYA